MGKPVVTLCIFLFIFPSRIARDGDGKPSTVAEPARIEAHLREVMVIGADEEASREYLLGNPKFVQSTSNGNIFIADEAAFGIKVYSASGEYLRTIGRHGEAPGELKRISSFTINQDNEILVADQLNRRITLFSEEGDVVNTFSYSRSEKIDTPRRILSLEGDRYLFIYKLSGEFPYDHMAHVVSLGDPIDEETSFISFSRTLGFSGVAANRLIQGGQAWLLDASNLLFVPQLHRGEIYRYQFNHREGVWEQKASLQGYVEVEEPFEELDPNNYDRDKIFYRSRGPEGLRVGIFNNQSLGVFELRNGHVVHFLYNLIRGKHVFGVEIFDETGTLLGHSPIPVLDNVEEEYYPYKVAWKDEADRFFLIDKRAAPVVRIVELDYTW